MSTVAPQLHCGRRKINWEGENFGVKHNSIFLRCKIFFPVSMSGRTELHAISNDLKLTKQGYTQRETDSSNSCKTQLILA